MYWVKVDEEYLDYLRKYESRIPYTNYGNDKIKPFFGVLFEKDGLCYVTQVSHPQPRHNKLKQSKDFYKLYENNTRLIGVVNLNYMFPMPKSILEEMKMAEIGNYRTFVSDSEKSKYIDLLNKELAEIERLELNLRAEELYKNKYLYPEDRVSKRCVDFKQLEELAKFWKCNTKQ